MSRADNDGRGRNDEQRAPHRNQADRRSSTAAVVAAIISAFSARRCLYSNCSVARLLSPMTMRCGMPINSASRSEEHTSELQSLMRISYAVFCLKKKKKHNNTKHTHHNT